MGDPGPARLGRILREPPLWLLVAATFAFMAWPLAVGRTYFFRDLHLWSIPQRQHLREIVRSGHVPLWDGLTHGGQPFAGDVNNLALYPTAALCLVLPAVTAVNLEIALHFALAAAAVYTLTRLLGMTPAAGLLASFAFTFCGISLSLANLWNRVLALPHMVLLLLFWHLFLRERRRRWFLLAAAAGALQLYAGSVETLLLSFPLAIAWGLVYPYPEPRPRRRGIAALALAALILALSAAQVAPMLEILAASARARGFSAAAIHQWSTNPRRLPELVVPGFFGRMDTLDERDYWGASQEDQGVPYLLSLYAGLTVGLLAAAGAVSRKEREPLPRRARRLLGGVAAGAVLLSFGGHLPWAAATATTPWAAFLRYPSKFLMVVPLCLGLLAASWAQALDSESASNARPSGLAALYAGGVAIFAALLAVLNLDAAGAASLQAFFFRLAPDPRIVHGLSRGLVHAAVAAGAAGALLLWRARNRGPGTRVVLGLALVAAVDLGWAGARVNATAPRRILETTPPLAAALLPEVGDGRLFRGPRAAASRLSAPDDELYWLAAASRAALLHNTATAFGIPVVYDEDFDGLASLRMVELTDTLSALPWDRRLPILSAGSVRAVLSAEPLAVDGLVPIDTSSSGQGAVFAYRNEKAAALAELVTYWRYAASPAQARGMLASKGFDPRRHAVLEGEGPPPGPGPCDRPSVRVVAREATSSTIRTESNCDGFLVLSEPHGPGWRATLDGAPVELRPANAAFTAVFVPAGRHEIRRVYRPRALAWGAAISLATFLGALAATGIGRRRASPA